MKHIYILILLLFLLLISSSNVQASKKTFHTSATLKSRLVARDINDKINFDSRVVILKKYFEKHNSPLVDYSKQMIKLADDFGIPWTMVPAIAGVESGFCKRIPYNSSNCWGWGNGKVYFASYLDGVKTVTKSLKKKYYDNGITSLEGIGRFYAPPTPEWASRVRYFMYRIENYKPSIHLIAIQFSI